jgi:hypothetical protein
MPLEELKKGFSSRYLHLVEQRILLLETNDAALIDAIRCNCCRSYGETSAGLGIM